MIRFVVMDVELCNGQDVYGPDDNAGNNNPQGPVPYALADVEVARESEFGGPDCEPLHCVTHLGNLLQPGDIVLGYDLMTSVLSGGAEWDSGKCFQSSFVMPDVVLVKKVKDKTIIDREDPTAAAAATTKNNNDTMDPKSRMTKRKERRSKRNEKKARELEESAERMGFLAHGEEDFNEGGDDYYMNDPDLVADLEEMEKDLAAIPIPEELEEPEEDKDDPSPEPEILEDPKAT
jgi:nonsense-mediated mRNA decay protein 3